MFWTIVADFRAVSVHRGLVQARRLGVLRSWVSVVSRSCSAAPVGPFPAGGCSIIGVSLSLKSSGRAGASLAFPVRHPSWRTGRPPSTPGGRSRSSGCRQHAVPPAVAVRVPAVRAQVAGGRGGRVVQVVGVAHAVAVAVGAVARPGGGQELHRAHGTVELDVAVRRPPSVSGISARPGEPSSATPTIDSRATPSASRSARPSRPWSDSTRPTPASVAHDRPQSGVAARWARSAAPYAVSARAGTGRRADRSAHVARSRLVGSGPPPPPPGGISGSAVPRATAAGSASAGRRVAAVGRTAADAPSPARRPPPRARRRRTRSRRDAPPTLRTRPEAPPA